MLRLNLWFIRMKNGWLRRWAWAFLGDWLGGLSIFMAYYDFLAGGLKGVLLIGYGYGYQVLVYDRMDRQTDRGIA